MRDSSEKKGAMVSNGRLLECCEPERRGEAGAEAFERKGILRRRKKGRERGKWAETAGPGEGLLN